MLKLFCDHDENLKGNDSQLASPERNDNIPSEAMLYGKLTSQPATQKLQAILALNVNQFVCQINQKTILCNVPENSV